jgi:hydroxypyruvate isomerase
VLESVVAGLRRVVPVVEQAGVTLMLEPMNTRVDHPGYALSTSRRVLDVVRAVGSPNVAVNWDLYHLQISEGDLTGHLREGFEHVAYVQVADHPGRHEPGTGELSFPFLLRTVRELGYVGYVGLECVPKDDPLASAWRIHTEDARSVLV